MSGTYKEEVSAMILQFSFTAFKSQRLIAFVLLLANLRLLQFIDFIVGLLYACNDFFREVLTSLSLHF